MKEREIFTDDQNRVKFLDFLATNKALYSIEVHAYVLMYSHFHLLLMTSEANLHDKQ